MSAGPTKTGVPLDRPLPAAVAMGSGFWLISWRSFPVFSRPWLLRRGLLFGVIIALWGALSALVHFSNHQDTTAALQLFAYFFVGVTIMVNAGPVMAGLVRHHVDNERWQRILVEIAIAVGLAVAFVADSWSSGHIERLSGQAPAAELSGAALALNLIVLVTIYFFLGGGLALRAYLGEKRRMAAFEQQQTLHALRVQKIESDQQLSLLQAQVEPHFLFNTLATVRSAIRHDPGRAEATLDALSAFLRATIPRLRAAEDGGSIALAEQLEVSRQYLKVMQLRMHERLEFDIQAEPAACEHPFPPYLLLALVENAIKHGIEPHPSGGRVRIRAWLEPDTLEVEVEDDGIGLPSQPGHGVGLANIRQQLRNRFGERATLRLASGDQGGVRARISVPREVRR